MIAHRNIECTMSESRRVCVCVCWLDGRCWAWPTLTHCIWSKTKINCHFQIDKTDVALQLIDIGKVIHVESLSDHKIYNLTQEAKLTPIRANLCKIEKVINFHFRFVLLSSVLKVNYTIISSVSFRLDRSSPTICHSTSPSWNENSTLKLREYAMPSK